MVQVYNFYTWTRPKEWEFSRHGACVRSISWLEDDSGFVSCYDENVCLWKLNPTEEDKESIVLKEGEPYYHGLVNNQPFVIKGANFSHVAVSKHDNDKHPLIYVCGSEKDRAIREVTQEGEGQAVELRSTVQYQDQVQLSKIAFTADRKFFFAGRIEGGMPGSVQVLAYPF